MVKLSYENQSGSTITYQVNSWEAVYCVAEALVKAPIELDYLEYQDGDTLGIFNLNTFERQ